MTDTPLKPANVRKLAATIAKQKHTNYYATSGFSMTYWRHICGTPCCMGGFASDLANEDGLTGFSEEVAAEWLGLTFDEAETFFYPPNRNWSAITPAEASARLIRLADHWDATGEKSRAILEWRD